jgi:hypothetical protein
MQTGMLEDDLNVDVSGLQEAIYFESTSPMKYNRPAACGTTTMNNSEMKEAGSLAKCVAQPTAISALS